MTVERARHLDLAQFQKYNGFYLRPDMRRIVFDLYEGVCQASRERISLENAHVGHIVPQSASDEFGRLFPGLDVHNAINLQLLHASHNLRTSDFFLLAPLHLHNAISWTGQVVQSRLPTILKAPVSPYARNPERTGKVAVSPVSSGEFSKLLEGVPSTTLGIRDRALLLICFSGALWRSEVVSLDWPDCEFTADGIALTLRRSKNVNRRAGNRIVIPSGASSDTCPVRALQAWRETSGASLTGPVFRPLNRHGQIHADRLSDQAVARAVKRYVAAAGLDPAKYSGHSLRAGRVAGLT